MRLNKDFLILFPNDFSDIFVLGKNTKIIVLSPLKGIPVFHQYFPVVFFPN